MWLSFCVPLPIFLLAAVVRTVHMKRIKQKIESDRIKDSLLVLICKVN